MKRIRQFLVFFVLLAIVLIGLVACGGQPKRVVEDGCPSLITATIGGQEVYRHEGKAWWYEYTEPNGNVHSGYKEIIGVDNVIRPYLADRSQAFLGALGIKGVIADFTLPANSSNETVWTDDGIGTCREFTTNYVLEFNFNTMSHLNQSGLGPVLVTEDFGDYVSFVVKNNPEADEVGASLSFSFPKTRLIPMLIDSYSDNEFSAVTANIGTHNYASDEDYASALSGSILDGQYEAITMHLPSSDESGRNYILRILPRVLSLVAVDYPDSTSVVLKGRLSDVETATFLSLSNGKVSTQKFFLGYMQTEAGLLVSFSQSANIADLTDASLFFVK